MQTRKLWRRVALVLLVAVFAFSVTQPVHAEVSSSPSYQITETQFGNSSTLQSCSSQYCAQASIGDADTSKTSSSASFAAIPAAEPTLEMIVDPGQSNLGVLSTEHPATKTTIVRIKDYLSGGYSLQIIGDPPKFDDHTLATPTNPTSSQPGHEQFAINAAANTLPSVGADVVQVPADSGIYGAVNPNYSAPNLFKYVSGDTIAHGVTDSGRADYTISMIVNISTATPAGHYTGDFVAVVIPAF
jgi:hypothetical protein